MSLDLDAIKARAESATVEAVVPYCKPIPGFPGYIVWRWGAVSSVRSWRGHGHRYLVPVMNGRGYLKVRLGRADGTRANRPIHRLVAEAFLPSQPSPSHEVRHLDGDRTNNNSDNLLWGTRKENAEDREQHGTTARGTSNGFARLTDADVQQVRHLASLGQSQRRIAGVIGVSQRTVGAVLRRERWGHVA